MLHILAALDQALEQFAKQSVELEAQRNYWQAEERERQLELDKLRREMSQREAGAMRARMVMQEVAAFFGDGTFNVPPEHGTAQRVCNQLKVYAEKKVDLW